MYLRNYRLSKTWLHHTLKRVVSKHPSTVNMLKCLRQLWNLHESTFIIFFHHSQRKWFGKYLPYYNLKFYACLLTHWLPMASTLFGIVRICSSPNAIILKTKNFFLHFLILFRRLNHILNLLKKKMTLIANVFPKLQTVRVLVRPLSKKLRFRKSFDSHYVKMSQILLKSAWENFIIFFHHSERKWFGKYLPYWNLKSQGCFLTYWLPMTSILFEILTICSSLFKCNYLKNKNIFWIFCSIYGIFIKF